MQPIILLLSVFCSSSYAQSGLEQSSPSEKIIVWQDTVNSPSGIIMDTLIQALEITRPEYGHYEIVTSMPMEQGRAVKSLAKAYQGQLDIAHFPTSINREKHAIAVRVPLIGGLLGYRVCLIKENHQYKFSQINNKQDFIDQEITIGQHQDWPDSKILRSNGLRVKTSHKYALLFQQLEKKRFDCFLRGLNEINDEYSLHIDARFAIENSLLIRYPYLMFFFVNESRPELAKRLGLGLTRLQKNGTLMRLLEHYYKDRLTKLHLKERKIIDLENTLLPDNSLQKLQFISWL